MSASVVKKLKVAACRLDQKGRLPNVGAASFCFLAVVTSVPDPLAGYSGVLFSSCWALARNGFEDTISEGRTSSPTKSASPVGRRLDAPAGHDIGAAGRNFHRRNIWRRLTD